MTVRLDSPRWLLVMSLHLLAVFLNQVISLADAGLVTSNSVLSPYNPRDPQDMLQRRLFKGREVIPPMSSNALPGEPSCEELRAMWRYYKRQSRAELTNEIPRFGSNIFWDILPGEHPRISSFAPLKGRNRARLKLKPKPSAYGRMIYKQEKARPKSKQPPRPMEQVAQMMGKGTPDETKEKGPPPEAIVHFSPPPTPVSTTPSSFQQIKDVFREERIRQKAPVANANPNENGKTFGRIILGPPRGMDGRVANKPRELMTPFEKIRFGHADDLLDEGSKPNRNLMAKRRTPPIQALNQQQVLIPRSQRFSGVVMPEYEETSPWMEVDTSGDVLQVGEDLDNRWLSLPLGVSLNDEEMGVRNPPGKLVLVEMQQQSQSQPFQPRTFSSNLPSSLDSPCQEVEGQPCQVNSDCSCTGFGLYRCYINQCQTLPFSPPGTGTEALEGDSHWHSGPLESSQLGFWEDANLTSGNNLPQGSSTDADGSTSVSRIKKSVD